MFAATASCVITARGLTPFLDYICLHRAIGVKSAAVADTARQGPQDETKSRSEHRWSRQDQETLEELHIGRLPH